jgi:C4-dicarboxylate transporter, DctQ subunit
VGANMENSIVTVEQQTSFRKVKALLKWVDRILESIERIVIALGLLTLTIVVVGTVISRYFFNYSPDWSDELPRFIVIWVTFIGMSYCVRKGEHVVIDMLFNKLQGKIKKYFSMIILLLCFLTYIYLTYIGYFMTVKIFETKQMSVTLGIPMGYVYLAVPVGCLLTAKNFLHIIIKNITSKGVFMSLNGRVD